MSVTQEQASTTEQSKQPTSKEPTMTPGQRFAGELLGTFLLVLFHAGASASSRMLAHGAHTPKVAPDVLVLALADGLSLFIIIMIVGKVSGVLINPAVTLGLASTGRFPRREVAPYLVAELLGAILGAVALLAIFGGDAASVGHLGAVKLSAGTNIWQGAFIEGLGAFVLVLAISATAEDPRSPSGWAGLAIGMTLAAIVLLIEPATGAAVNPARAFGPDFVGVFTSVQVNWLNYVVCYLIGPIVGAVLAAHVYRALAGQPAQKPKPEGQG